MYSLHNRTRIISILMVILFCLGGTNVFSFNLGDEIYSSFQRQYNGLASDSYMETPYSSSLSKDPFKDALNDIESMSMQVKIAGVEYIEGVLAEKNCTLSRKKIQAILYYFVPEFRSELVRTLKLNKGEYNSKNFVFSDDEILKYCTEFFECDQYRIEGKDVVTPKISKDPASRCKEFFQENYEKGEKDKKKDQNVQISQLGADKYWNSTTDDSSYDIMTDFGNIGTLLYTQAEQPITPVFYNLPIFSNSKQGMKNHKESGSSTTNGGNSGKTSGSQGGRASNGGNSGGGGNTGGTTGNVGGITGSVGGITGNVGGITGSVGGITGSVGGTTGSVGGYTGNESTGGNGGGGYNSGSSSDPLPLVVKEIDEYDYDDLIEGLGAASVSQKKSLYYGSLCEDKANGDIETDIIEDDILSDDMPYDGTTDYSDIDYEVNDVSDEELETLMDYMKGAVDSYLELPKEKKEEIRSKAGNPIRHTEATAPSQLEIVAEEIKGCYQSCEGLRFDQKASCMLMCACGEIESPIFNPEQTPGLGPILMIRFCTVPAVATNFSAGGKRIVSIQEGVNEIYGVVDKLSREGKLGMWTQQNNFLDASTKKMNVAKTVAFTISMEFVDVTGKPKKESKQSKERDIKDANKELQRQFGIKNDLDNPVSKNKNRLIGKEGEVIKDITATANADVVRQSLDDLSKSPSFMVDPLGDSNSNRYIDASNKLVKYLDQQAELWLSINDYVKQLDENAKALNGKKG